jgi:hypothetical protein
VVHFKEQFIPPAPFKFVILNKELQTQHHDFVLRVKTLGKVVPENAMIFIGDESYYMESAAHGEFEFKITKPIQDVSFHVEANAIVSTEYELKVVTVPTIANFEMQLQFPAYLNKNPKPSKAPETL